MILRLEKYNKKYIEALKNEIKIHVDRGVNSIGNGKTHIERQGLYARLTGLENDIVSVGAYGVYSSPDSTEKNEVFTCNEVWVEFGSIDREKVYKIKEIPDKLKKYNESISSFNANVIDAVVDDILSWLFSGDVKVGDQFSKVINQGERDCEVIKVGRTRARIAYEMPNAGDFGGYIPIVNLFGRKLYCKGY